MQGGDEVSEIEEETIEGKPMKFRVKSKVGVYYANERSALEKIIRQHIIAGAPDIAISIAPDDDIPMVVVNNG
jgi:hypothetical protein